MIGLCFCSVGWDSNLELIPRARSLENWEGWKKDPGIGWSRDHRTPKNLGCNKLVVTRFCIMLILTGTLRSRSAKCTSYAGYIEARILR